MRRPLKTHMIGSMSGMLRDVFVHRLALVESRTIGAGTRVWPFAHVMKGAVVGRGCNIGEHCFIESGAVIGHGATIKNGVAVWDGVTIGDDVFVGPFAVFTNVKNPRSVIKKTSSEFEKTAVKKGATVGANSTLVCGITIHEHAFIAAGSVVARDVAPYRLVAGVPARVKGWMCVCGLQLESKLRCACGARYRMGRDGIRPVGSP